MRLERFTGLKTADSPIDVGLGGLVRARNLDATRNGLMKTRMGRERVFDGAVDAAWSDDRHFLFLSGGDLYRMLGQNYELLGAMAGSTLTAAYVAGRLFVHSDREQKVIEGSQLRDMGLSVPSVPSVSVGSGGLKAGLYRVAVANVDQGRESALSPSAIVEVLDNSSISVAGDRIYASHRNGEELYFFADGAVTLDVDAHLIDPASRQNLQPFPSAQILAAWQGRLLAAVGNFLMWSAPFDYEITDPFDSIPFESEITAVAPTMTGVFVSDQYQTHFLSGTSPDDWVRRTVYDRPIKPNTAKPVPLNRVGEGSAGEGILFVSTAGVCLGTPDGFVTNLSERRIGVMPTATHSLTATYNRADSRYVVAIS